MSLWSNGKHYRKILSRPIFDFEILPGLRRTNDLEILYLSHKMFINKNEKITHRVGGNICKWSDWQGISLQNIQTAHIAQYWKANNPIQKKSGRTRHFSIEDKQMANNHMKSSILLIIQFSSVAQLCVTLPDPMNHSTPHLPVHHQLLEFTQTHIHRVSDAIQPSHPPSSPSPPAFNLSQHQGLFQWISSSHQVAKVLEFQLQHQSFQWIFRTDFL